MALGTPTVVSTINSATDATSYIGSSGSPGANMLLVAIVGATDDLSADPPTPTVINTPWGLTWARDARGDNNWGGTGAVRRVGWVFYAATGTAPSADTFDISFGATTVTSGEAICLAISGADIASPLAALVQNVPGVDTSTPYNVVTLSAASHADNRTLAFYAINSNEDIIHDSGGGWSEITQAGHNTPTITYAAHWLGTGFDTTPTASTALNKQAGQWGLEIKAAVTSSSLIYSSGMDTALLAQ